MSRNELYAIVEKDREIMEALTRFQRFIQALTLSATLDIRERVMQPPMDLSPIVQQIVAHIDDYMKEHEESSTEAAELACSSDPLILRDVAVQGGMSKEDFEEQLGSFADNIKQDLQGQVQTLLQNYDDAVVRESKIIQKQQQVLLDFAEAHDEDMQYLKANQDKVLKNTEAIQENQVPPP